MYKITEDIYIGGVATVQEVSHNKIKCVLLLSDVPTEYPVYNYHIFDSGNNDPKKFIEILEAIDKHLKVGDTPIFLNCVQPPSCFIYGNKYIEYCGFYVSQDKS